MSAASNLFEQLGISAERAQHFNFARLKKSYLNKLTELHNSGNSAAIEPLKKAFDELRSSVFAGSKKHYTDNVVFLRNSPITPMQVAMGAGMTLIGAQFISIANKHVVAKLEDGKPVTFVDRALQGLAYAGTGVVAVLTASLGVSAIAQRLR